MKPIPYGKQNITDQDIQAVIETLQSDYLTQGPKIEEFEKKFAKYIGCNYAVAVANGTAALHLSAMALGVNERSKVISTPLTFAASSNCIYYCGGSVDFVDINPETLLLDFNLLEEKLSNSPKETYQGIVVVDFAGMPANLERLKIIAEKYQLWILEDACHAPGAYFTDSKDQKQFCGNGNFAELAIFSFHPVKHIACGEGGMITTNNKDFYEKLKTLRTHGITKDKNLLKENHGGWYYEMQELGYNYRLTDFQAALGISQLSEATERLKRRREIAAIYDRAFEGMPLKIFPEQEKEAHAYHLYIIHVKKRKELYDHLRSKQIFCQVHYIPVHFQPFYQKQGFKKGMFPNTEAYYDGCLSLPMYPSLTDSELDYVINTIKSFL
jgi:UDP-4-amino-4,6-dideoxy-N-acetyl-beta-L-altrosamine transaminase